MAYYLSKILQTWSTPEFDWDDDYKPGPIGSPIGYSLGFWVDQVKLPSRGHRTRKKRIPDVFMIDGVGVFSQRFKDLVDEFEPDIHQFIPVTLTDHDGSKVEPDYYIFNCMVAIDTILLKESGLEWGFFGDWKQPLIKIPEYLGDFRWKLSKPQIAGRHFWVDFLHRPPSGGFYVSDEVFKEIEKRKIRFFRNRYCEELDIPWSADECHKPRLDWEAEHGLQKDSRSWVKDRVQRYRERTGR